VPAGKELAYEREQAQAKAEEGGAPRSRARLDLTQTPSQSRCVPVLIVPLEDLALAM
jgi:hypothetical protein